MNPIMITYGGNNRLNIKVPYNPDYIQKIKTLSQYTWVKEKKLWQVDCSTDTIRLLKDLFKDANIKWAFSIQQKYPDAFFRGLEALIEELTIRRYSKRTIKAYIFYNREFLQFAGKKSEDITNDDVKKFLYHLTVDKCVSSSTVDIVINSIKFFYAKILHKTFIYDIPRPQKQRKLPRIVSKYELKNIFASLHNLKHKTLLIVAYSGGLRVSDVVKLKISDIDFHRRSIFVKDSKGNKDRYTLISEIALEFLKKYINCYSPRIWLFEGQQPETHLSTRTAQKIFENAMKKSGIQKQLTFHSLRHSFSTHLLENGTDIRYIQDFLGHKSIKTTEIYTHITKKNIRNIRSPMDSDEFDGM